MTEVQVAIYDLSEGVCKQLSPMLLGKQLDGIWHTGIVVYELEISFGADGISKIAKFQTSIGEPLEVKTLGKTKKSLKEIEVQIKKMGEGKFSATKYNFLENNCNNFSDEMARWLTGEGIPAHIVSLPKDVLDSPGAALLRPFLEQAGQVVAATTTTINPTDKKQTDKK